MESDNTMTIENPYYPPHVVILGDAMVDTYVEVYPKDLSAEAPIPRFMVSGNTRDYPGGASNVDSILNQVVNRKLGVLYYISGNSVAIKTRYIHNNIQVFRVDQDGLPRGYQGTSNPLEDFAGLDSITHLVISDYNKGTVTEEVIKTLEEGLHPKTKIYIDTKTDPINLS